MCIAGDQLSEALWDPGAPNPRDDFPQHVPQWPESGHYMSIGMSTVWWINCYINSVTNCPVTQPPWQHHIPPLPIPSYDLELLQLYLLCVLDWLVMCRFQYYCWLGLFACCRSTPQTTRVAVMVPTPPHRSLHPLQVSHCSHTQSNLFITR